MVVGFVPALEKRKTSVPKTAGGMQDEFFEISREWTAIFNFSCHPRKMDLDFFQLLTHFLFCCASSVVSVEEKSSTESRIPFQLLPQNTQ